jgi:outer membrane receptor protein involved in Fe transport
LTRSVVTDADGAYRLISLPPGEYEIRVAATGFAPLVRNEFTLLVSQNARLDLTLALTGASAEMNVPAEAPAIDIAETAASVSVDQERIEELPVTQRRFLNFVLTAPGVVAAGSQLRGGARPGSIGARNLPDSGFSFGGLRPRSNNITIDGVDNNDETTGAGCAELSIEAIREFQVVNNGASAESGGSAGGSVNAVTRSGGNEFHGGAFLYTAHEAFNARQPLFAAAEAAERKPEFRRWQPGFDVGGPIRPDRTFFHATLEQEHEAAEDASDIAPPVAARINAALAAGALPRLGARRLLSDFFATNVDDTEGAFKINQQIGQASSAMLRYAYTNDRRWRDALGAGGLYDRSARGDAFTRDHALVGQALSVISPSVVNDLRFQLARRRVLFRPNESNGPLVTIAGNLTFGRLSDAPSDRTEDHYQLLDSIALGRGHHQLRLGGGVNHVRLDASLPDRLGGFAIFDGVDDLLAERAELFAQAFGDPRTRMAVTSTGLFAQDHWQARPALNFTLGLRYDYEALPAIFHRDARNLSPRLGVAWSPGGAHRWVIRGAFGLYFDRYLLAFLNPALQRDGARGFEQILNGASAAAAFRQTQAARSSRRCPASGLRSIGPIRNCKRPTAGRRALASSISFSATSRFQSTIFSSRARAFRERATSICRRRLC